MLGTARWRPQFNVAVVRVREIRHNVGSKQLEELTDCCPLTVVSHRSPESHDWHSPGAPMTTGERAAQAAIAAAAGP